MGRNCPATWSLNRRPRSTVGRKRKIKPLIGGREPLSRREIEICDLLSRDLNGKEVAHALGVAPETVRTHRGNIMRKMQIHTAAGLIRKCFELGYIRIDAAP